MGLGERRWDTDLVFHTSCAALTFTLADSAVKGGKGGLPSEGVAGAVVDAISGIYFGIKGIEEVDYFERCETEESQTI